MKLLTTGLTLAAAAFATAAPMFVAATPATAAARDGSCDSGEFCYYYNSNEVGAISDFTASEDDYGSTQPSCYEFKGSDAEHGEGKCTKNNAASVWNRTDKTVTVYYNSGWAGSTQTIASGAKANLNATLKNNNASHQIGAASGGSTCSGSGLGNPNTCTEAVAWAKNHEGSTSLGAGTCDHVAGLAYGWSASGSHDAALHWAQVPSAYKHAGSRTVPAGALAFFTGGSQGYGHVMVSLGGGSFMSTDISASGGYSPNHYNRTTISGLESAFGTVNYVGWAQPWFKVNH